MSSPSTPSSLEFPDSPDVGQKKRGRPRLSDDDVAAKESEREKLIYKRKYARKYREKIRSDLREKEELRRMLGKIEEDNRRLRDTLETLKRENALMIQNLIALASVPRPAAPNALSHNDFRQLVDSALRLQGEPQTSHALVPALRNSFLKSLTLFAL